jgi:hypothetical protein
MIEAKSRGENTNIHRIEVSSSSKCMHSLMIRIAFQFHQPFHDGPLSGSTAQQLAMSFHDSRKTSSDVECTQVQVICLNCRNSDMKWCFY